MTEFRIQFFIGKNELGELHERITGLRTLRDWSQQTIVNRKAMKAANGAATTPTNGLLKQPNGEVQRIIARTIKSRGGTATVAELIKAIERGKHNSRNLSTAAKKLGLKRSVVDNVNVYTI